MANKNMKHPQNVAGKFYCTDANDMSGQGCISCGVCYSMAPDHFQSDDMGAAFVAKQPVADEEKAACKEAMESCPVSSIGDDGE
ncbi:MAG: ferredoxin [Alphaproteobacteria bacterium]|nr:ferredoxin [Alphaproteobacteria bacterium]MBN2780076.1 ferredoxin [Alphaproteobacteria bacterium]